MIYLRFSERAQLSYEALVLRFERSGKNLNLIPRLALQTAREWFDDEEDREVAYDMLIRAANTNFTK